MYTCPEDFKLFCKNFEIKCHKCLANDKASDKLYYEPIKSNSSLSFTSHPAYKQLRYETIKEKQNKLKEKKKSKEYKNSKAVYNKSIKLENQANKQLGAKNTLGSGRVFSDGDGILKLDRDYYIEHKARLNNRNTLGPTRLEWEKAKAQSIELFIVTSSTEGSIVTMKLETLKELLNI